MKIAKDYCVCAADPIMFSVVVRLKLHEQECCCSKNVQPRVILLLYNSLINSSIHSLILSNLKEKKFVFINRVPALFQRCWFRKYFFLFISPIFLQKSLC